MTRPLLLAVLSILAAGSVVEDLVRRGNVAYERGDYDGATAAYTEAETRIADPGLAAFNKAAALYEKGHYRDAELSFRCCLEDAAGPRRTFALYGLGTALVQQGRERGAEALREAIRSYEECLRQPNVSAELADDARHDIELAKLLVLRAPSKPSDKPETKAENEEEKPKPPERQQTPDPGLAPFGQGKADARGDKQRVRREQAKDAQQSEEGSTGAGTELPPVPDEADRMPMTKEDAAEHLKRAAARVLNEQRAHQRQRRTQGSEANGLDW